MKKPKYCLRCCKSLFKNDTDEQQLAVPEAVQGNSGGLLLALAFYEQMTGQNIARGLRISGSGTLTNEGFVQPVLGIKQKILAANQHQIDVFLFIRIIWLRLNLLKLKC